MFSMRHVLAVSLLPLLMWSLPAGAESSGQLRDQARSAQSELSSVKKQISTAQKKLRLTQA